MILARDRQWNKGYPCLHSHRQETWRLHHLYPATPQADPTQWYDRHPERAKRPIKGGNRRRGGGTHDVIWAHDRLQPVSDSNDRHILKLPSDELLDHMVCLVIYKAIIKKLLDDRMKRKVPMAAVASSITNSFVFLTNALASPIICLCPCEKLLPPLSTLLSNPISVSLAPSPPIFRCDSPAEFRASLRTASLCSPRGPRFSLRVHTSRSGLWGMMDIFWRMASRLSAAMSSPS